MEDDGRGWNRMEVDGRGWNRMEEDGRGRKRREEDIDDRCRRMVEGLCLCPVNHMCSWQKVSWRLCFGPTCLHGVIYFFKSAFKQLH